MGAVSISRDDFKPVNGICVTDNVFELQWSVLFHPDGRTVDVKQEWSLANCEHELAMVVHRPEEHHFRVLFLSMCSP